MLSYLLALRGGDLPPSLSMLSLSLTEGRVTLNAAMPTRSTMLTRRSMMLMRNRMLA